MHQEPVLAAGLAVTGTRSDFACGVQRVCVGASECRAVSFTNSGTVDDRNPA